MHTPIFISIFLTQKKNIPKIFCFKRKTKEYLKNNVKYILQKLESAKIHKTFDNCWQRFFWVRKNFCFHKHFISNTFFVFFFLTQKIKLKKSILGFRISSNFFCFSICIHTHFVWISSIFNFNATYIILEKLTKQRSLTVGERRGYEANWFSKFAFIFQLSLFCDFISVERTESRKERKKNAKITITK